MRHSTLKFLVAATVAAGLAACKDSLVPLPVSDAQLTADISSSTADAVTNEVGNLLGNEAAAALPSSGPSFNVFGSPMASETVTVTRSRTCFDGTGTVIACSPLTNVRKIVTSFTVDGSRVGIYFTGAVHRSANDTLTRNFTGSTEVSRTHTALIQSHDTTTFADTAAAASGLHIENASDSVNAVTLKVPRTQPTDWIPLSGSVVRNVNVHASYTKGGTTVTRDVTKRIEIDFNGTATAVLKIDAKTCDLNLLTRTVSNCH